MKYSDKDNSQQSYAFSKHIGHSKEFIYYSWCVREKLIKVGLPDNAG